MFMTAMLSRDDLAQIKKLKGAKFRKRLRKCEYQHPSSVVQVGRFNRSIAYRAEVKAKVCASPSTASQQHMLLGTADSLYCSQILQITSKPSEKSAHVQLQVIFDRLTKSVPGLVQLLGNGNTLLTAHSAESGE